MTARVLIPRRMSVRETEYRICGSAPVKPGEDAACLLISTPGAGSNSKFLWYLPVAGDTKDGRPRGRNGEKIGPCRHPNSQMLKGPKLKNCESFRQTVDENTAENCAGGRSARNPGELA